MEELTPQASAGRTERAKRRLALTLTRFDRLVWLTLALLWVATAVVVARGDQVGIRVVAVSPADGAEGVSSLTPVQATFSQPILLTGALRSLVLDPPVGGTAQWRGDTLVFYPSEPLQPDTLYTATVPAGLQGEQGGAVRRPFRWQFRTGHPRVLFMATDQEDRYQVFLLDPAQPDVEPIQLSAAEAGVWDYAPSADGRQVAFAAVRADGGSDLWTVATDATAAAAAPRQVLACPDAFCSGPAWHPDGQRLIYERRALLNADGAQAPPRLWWLDLASGETVPVFDDSQWLGFGASLSADGRWLSHVAPDKQAIYVYNLEDGRSLEVPTQMNEPAVWSPQSPLLLYVDMVAGEGGYASHILRVNAESGQVVDLSDPATRGDASPAWSPDGREIAFTRRTAENPIGGQIRAMPAAGGEGQVLYESTDYHHGGLTWSPDGRSLLMQRTVLRQVGSPEVWQMDRDGGNWRRISPSGAWPRWLP